MNGWVDDLPGVKDLYANGVLVTRRAALDIIGDASLTDNPTSLRSELRLGGGSQKPAVRVATAAALAAYTRSSNTLTANANGALAAIDGVTLVAGDSFLLQNGAAGADNGVYTLTSPGSVSTKWTATRRADFATSADLANGALLLVREGSTYADKILVLTTDAPITLNTTALAFSSVGGVGQLGRHPLIANTVGLWQLNGDLLDTSGNNLHLSWQDPGSGVYDKFLELYPGYVGQYNDSVNFRGAFRNANDAALQITGDMTVEFIARVDTRASLDRYLVAHGTEGSETLANNYLYGIKYSNTAQSAGLDWISENASGSDSNFTPGNTNSSASTPRPGLPHMVPFHFAATRTSNIVQMYVNGKPWGPPSNALTTPTGGTTGKLYVLCGSDGSPMYGSIATLRILNVTRSAANILADYNLLMGAVFGTRS